MEKMKSPIKSQYKQARKEIEDAKIDYYLVQKKSFFDDDVEVKCSKCGEKCFCRPYYPRNAKIICIECMGKTQHKRFRIDKMDEKDIDNKINFIAKTTLGGLKGVFFDNNLDDRQATLCLMRFIEVFVRLGWKDNEPINVLESLIQVLHTRK